MGIGWYQEGTEVTGGAGFQSQNSIYCGVEQLAAR